MLIKSYRGVNCRLTIGLSLIVAAAGWMNILAGTAFTQDANSPALSAKAATPSAADTPTNADKIKRWVELDLLNFSMRFRHITNNVHTNSTDVLQHRFQAKGRFKFDRKGNYSVHAGVFTGSSLTSGWGSTGLGTGGPQTGLYVKLFYFEAKPVKGLDIQFGGIAPINGENTEITGYDNDAYLMGRRLSIRNAKKFFFDEISFTDGHLGDVNRPSVFRRFKRLDESNYHQFLVRKTVNKNLAFSADYTFESGRDTFRQAVRFSIPNFKLFDSIRFENYQQVDPDLNYGFALSGDKKVSKRLGLKTGFARIDTNMFNGDVYPRGNRIFGAWSYTLTRELNFNGIWIHGIGPLPSANSTRTRFEAALTFNILETLKRFKFI